MNSQNAVKVHFSIQKDKIHAANLRRRMAKYYSEIYKRRDKSKAYGILCETVHGIDLTQNNNMAKEQLDFLIKILHLDENNRVLDLGCGLGRITEYISEVTRAHITGLDIAEGAIQLAQNRTKEKRKRLTFVIGDFNQLSFSEDSFDTTISIDALYTNLDATINQLKSIIKPGGQMGIHLMQEINPGDSKERLLPENTDLARIFKKYNMKFRTWDFTQNTLDLTREWIKISKKLKPDFEAEGNLDLCFTEEAEESLHRWETKDVMRQFLYHVRL